MIASLRTLLESSNTDDQVSWQSIYLDLQKLGLVGEILHETILRSLLIETILTEASKAEILAQKYGLSVEAILAIANEVDPTPNHAYLDWILRHRKAGKIILPEDAGKIKEQLEGYTQLKRKSTFEGEKDINRLDPSGLYSLLTKFGDVKGKKESVKAAEQEGVRCLTGDAQNGVYEVTKCEAGAVLFRGTNWCVKDPKYFNLYKPSRYYIILRGGERVALYHPESGQLKAPNDAQLPLLRAVPLLNLLKDAGILPSRRDTLRGLATGTGNRVVLTMAAAVHFPEDLEDVLPKPTEPKPKELKLKRSRGVPSLAALVDLIGGTDTDVESILGKVAGKEEEACSILDEAILRNGTSRAYRLDLLITVRSILATRGGVSRSGLAAALGERVKAGDSSLEVLIGHLVESGPSEDVWAKVESSAAHSSAASSRYISYAGQLDTLRGTPLQLTIARLFVQDVYDENFKKLAHPADSAPADQTTQAILDAEPDLRQAILTRLAVVGAKVNSEPLHAIAMEAATENQYAISAALGLTIDDLIQTSPNPAWWYTCFKAFPGLYERAKLGDLGPAWWLIAHCKTSSFSAPKEAIDVGAVIWNLFKRFSTDEVIKELKAIANAVYDNGIVFKIAEVIGYEQLANAEILDKLIIQGSSYPPPEALQTIMAVTKSAETMNRILQTVANASQQQSNWVPDVMALARSFIERTGSPINVESIRHVPNDAEYADLHKLNDRAKRQLTKKGSAGGTSPTWNRILQ